jgi:hypothetical protein
MADITKNFEGMISVLEKMSPEYKEKLIKNYQEFSRLKDFCSVKGMIEILPGLRGIKVLKNTKEVRQLKKVIDFLKPGGFIWQDKDEKLSP